MQIPTPCFCTVLLHTTIWFLLPQRFCCLPSQGNKSPDSFSRTLETCSQGNKSPESCWRRGGMAAWLMEQRVGIGLEIHKVHQGPSWFQLNIWIHRTIIDHTRARLLWERQVGMTALQKGNIRHSFKKVLAAAHVAIHRITESSFRSQLNG